MKITLALKAPRQISLGQRPRTQDDAARSAESAIQLLSNEARFQRWDFWGRQSCLGALPQAAKKLRLWRATQ